MSISYGGSNEMKNFEIDGIQYWIDITDSGAIIFLNRKLVSINKPVYEFIINYIYYGLDKAEELLKINYSLKEKDKKEFIENMFKLFTEENIFSGLEWIIGLPGTTIEDELRDLNAMYIFIANNIVDFIEPYILVPHPNTEFCKNNLKYNIEITNCYEEMLEEGGIPQISYNELNRKQIYVLYLISNIVISEAYKAQGHMNIKEFKKIMELFNE